MKTKTLLLFNLCLASFLAQAQPAEKHFPLMVNVDGEYVRTAFQLALPIELLGADGQGTANWSQDEAGKAFSRLLRAFQSKDLKALAEQLEIPPQPGQEPVAAPGAHSALVEGYHAAFGGMQDVRLFARTKTDRGELMIWRVQTQKGSLLRGFIYRHTPGKPAFLHLSGHATPIEIFIVNNLDKVAGLSPQAMAVPNLSGERAVLKLAGSGARLEFPLMKTTAALQGVSKVVADRYAVRAEGPGDATLAGLQAFAAAATPASRAKLQQWFPTLPPDGAKAFDEVQRQGRKIRFSLNGEAVRLVFFDQIEDITTHRAGTLNYEYFLKSDGTYRLTNVFRESLLDDALRAALGRPGATLQTVRQ